MKWDKKTHAKDWLLFPDNIGPLLSIDETSLANGELYTILTNKAAKGKQGALVAIVAGTQAETVISVIKEISEQKRNQVKEITLDMADSMALIAKRCFPKADLVTETGSTSSDWPWTPFSICASSSDGKPSMLRMKTMNLPKKK
jgi:hypothetical protein